MTILNRGSQRHRDRTKYNRKKMENQTYEIVHRCPSCKTEILYWLGWMDGDSNPIIDKLTLKYLPNPIPDHKAYCLDCECFVTPNESRRIS